MKYECAQRDPSKLRDRQNRHANILPLKLEITIWQVFHLTTVKMGMVGYAAPNYQLSKLTDRLFALVSYLELEPPPR